MKNYFAVHKYLLLLMLALTLGLSSCALEPMQANRPIVRGAPDWVNKGSYTLGTGDARMFYGVSSANPQGDLALQKSIADDRANAEVVQQLSQYLETVGNDFLNTMRGGENDYGDELLGRQIEAAAVKQVNEGVTTQINEAMSRQFKEKISTQFRDTVTNKIKDASQREVRDAIAYQIEMSLHLQEVITRQIKEALSRQMRLTAKAHLVSAKIIGGWRDPRTNTIWSISELNLKNVKNSMANIEDLNGDVKKFFDANAENIFDRMMQEQENPNPFAMMFK
jgi:hypothetical protein